MTAVIDLLISENMPSSLHSKDLSISLFENDGYYTLDTPWGDFEGKNEQGCYDAFLDFCEEEPHMVANRLMPDTALPLGSRAPQGPKHSPHMTLKTLIRRLIRLTIYSATLAGVCTLFLTLTLNWVGLTPHPELLLIQTFCGAVPMCFLTKTY